MFYPLLIEITSHDLTVIGGTIITVLLTLGFLAVAIKNIRSEWIQPVWNFFFAPLIIRRRKITEIIVKVDKLTETTDRIEHEVRTNSGSSLKDSVIRIEKGQEYLHSKLRHTDHISQDCLFETDASGNFVFVNRALCELLGVESSDLLNRAWLMRIEPEKREKVKNEWREAIENKISLDSRQMMIDGRDGLVYEFRIHAQPNINGAGVLLGFFGHVKEIK